MDDNSTAPTPVESPTSGVYIPHQADHVQPKAVSRKTEWNVLCVFIF